MFERRVMHRYGIPCYHQNIRMFIVELVFLLVEKDIGFSAYANTYYDLFNVITTSLTISVSNYYPYPVKIYCDCCHPIEVLMNKQSKWKTAVREVYKHVGKDAKHRK